MYRCTKCGQCKKFKAVQPTYGDLAVFVDGAGEFTDNCTDDGNIDINRLEFDHPHTLTCPSCGVPAVEQSDDEGRLAGKSRHWLEDVLDSIGIHSSDDESDDTLREAILVNLADGTLSRDAINSEV